MAKPRKVQHHGKDRIKINGLFGSFETPNEGITVKYFSTHASGQNPGTSQYRLLEELKPMREKVTASELKNLNSLLQRDLNDARVATQLIPYLLGKTSSKVAFFPAILGVLIPQGFLTEENSATYPEPGDEETDEEDEISISYGDYWTATEYENTDGSFGPLGELSLSPDETDIIVLDGQHRVNAFRYLCGLLKKDDGETQIYDSFYEEVGGPPQEYSSELPVNLIWFEKDSNIDPKIISRNLFVDVNNSAKKVSKSRNILLDDRLVTSLLTRFFYSGVASQCSFKSKVFSLLHSGFDIDTDISKRSGHDFTVTNPEIIEYTLSWLMLGTDRYNSLDRYSVGRERKRNNTSSLEEIFNRPKFNQSDFEKTDYNEDIVISETSKIEDFESEFNTLLFDSMYSVLNKYCLLQKQYEASEETESWVYEKGSTRNEDAWEEVFTGGEGLYYSLMFSSITDNPKIETHQKAIEEIEEKLSSKRAEKFEDSSQKDVDRVFEVIRTKAFNVGVFMALKKFGTDKANIEEDENWTDYTQEFIERINDISADEWVEVFTTLKSKVEPSLDPKRWPSLQKFFLRTVQKDGEYYNPENYLDSPDGHVFVEELTNKFESYVETEIANINNISFEKIPKDMFKSWTQAARNLSNSIVKRCGWGVIPNVDYQDYGEMFVRERIKKMED